MGAGRRPGPGRREAGDRAAEGRRAEGDVLELQRMTAPSPLQGLVVLGLANSRTGELASDVSLSEVICCPLLFHCVFSRLSVGLPGLFRGGAFSAGVAAVLHMVHVQA